MPIDNDDTIFDNDTFPQRLRQVRPIVSLDDLGAAAWDAGRLALTGEINRAAAECLWEMAVARGLVDEYGEDIVQAQITAGLAAVELQQRPASSEESTP